MAFEKLLAFTKDVSDLADQPSLTPAELKAQFDAAPDEVRVYLNKLVDALLKTTAGDSGAKNVKATTISGLTGNDVQTLLEKLKLGLDDLKVLQGWYGMTGMNGWANLGTGGYNTLQYSKDKLGWVRIRGVVGGGSANTQISSLPVGYRPGGNYAFSVVTGGPSARIDVKTDGSVSLNGTFTSFVFLDGICFLAEN